MIDDLKNKLKSLPNELVTFFEKVIERNFAELEDINTDQLIKGKNAEGSNLARYKSASYARFKKSIGSKSSPIADLKVTGDFHRALKIKKTGKGEFEFYNTDEKAPLLLQKYPNVLGLSDKSKEEFTQDQLIDEMREMILQHLSRK